MKFVQKENFKPKIKPMISNRENELYQLKTSNEIVLNFVLTLSRSFSAKKAPKVSSEYENFLAKFLKKRKHQMNILIFARQKYL